MSNDNQMSMAQLISELIFQKERCVQAKDNLLEQKNELKAENDELKMKIDELQTEIDRLKEQLEYSDISKVNTVALVQELSGRENVTLWRDSGRFLTKVDSSSEPRILIKID